MLPTHSVASAANTLRQESEIGCFLMDMGCSGCACLYPYIPIGQSSLAWLLTLGSVGGPTRRCLSKEAPEPHPSGLPKEGQTGPEAQAALRVYPRGQGAEDSTPPAVSGVP